MNNQVTIKSLGAAETVTGSKHLLTTPEITILVDCGLFQGLKTLRNKNWEILPVDATQIDALLLTHAHLDHCGYIPLLVKKGFKGKIYMTAPTRDLTEIILRDSAKIQEEEAQFANDQGYSKHTPALPLYTTDDVERALPLFVEVEHSQVVQLSDSVSFQFRKNGHILGSCSIQMSCYDKKIVFSGDIGRNNSRFLLPPAALDGADYVVMESTYGDRLHPDTDPLDQLAKVINDATEDHGAVIIPSFAVGRAQEIMHLINLLKKEGRISTWIPVFLDSPMAANATDILCKYPKWHKLSKEECDSVCHDVIINRDFHNTRNIIEKKGAKIIISASGMLTGGRILEYMKSLAPVKKNTVLLIGYQAEGTRGRALQNNAHELKIRGTYVPVRCKVVEITGLSGHADQKELLLWLKQFEKRPPQIFLVHGEPSSQQAFKLKIEYEFKWKVKIPKENEESVLFEVKASAHA
ncbi:MAG: MBL fold metallo-hydrolase [Bacteroidetes bacterium 46-16]|nr:MAG: MBL fold metallo-hydrolase [Bacteroidetes bacterium 46-16]